MSRNFEMLQQAEQSRTLFRSPVALPPPPTPHVVPKPAEPEQQVVEQQTREKWVRQGQSSNGQSTEVAKISQGLLSFPWRAWLQAAIKWLGIQSNGHTRTNRGYLDFKSIAQQEEIKLVERVFLGQDSGSNKVILFSGVDEAEGGARVCAQAAQTLAAQVQGTVCLIDADLHSRSLQRHLQIGNAPGLSEAVLQSTPISRYAQPLASSNLWMITCGGDEANSRVPLNSDLMRIKFEELRRHFDYVLINAPSAGTNANLMQFAQLSDGVIFVVEANSTRRETTKRFKESLEEVRVRVLGVVLNDRTFPIPESVYRKL
jgi:Mrp family chromosome partitioning ATPase